MGCSNTNVLNYIDKITELIFIKCNVSIFWRISSENASVVSHILLLLIHAVLAGR